MTPHEEQEDLENKSDISAPINSIEFYRHKEIKPKANKLVATVIVWKLK